VIIEGPDDTSRRRSALVDVGAVLERAGRADDTCTALRDAIHEAQGSDPHPHDASRDDLPTVGERGPSQSAERRATIGVRRQQPE
jgi:hypothetical protein